MYFLNFNPLGAFPYEPSPRGFPLRGFPEVKVNGFSSCQLTIKVTVSDNKLLFLCICLYSRCLKRVNFLCGTCNLLIHDWNGLGVEMLLTF